MRFIKGFNEKYHVNDDVKKYTKLVYKEIDKNINKLVNNGELNLTNLLKNNYPDLFMDDQIFVKIGKNHGAINKPLILDDKIYNFSLYLTIELSRIEITQLKLQNNKISETINHEFQHLIELYHSDGKLSKSWSFHKRLQEHKDKFSDYVGWMDICHFFYLSEEHELRARTSGVYELLKNGDDLFTNDVYRSCLFLCNINADFLVKKMFSENENFEEILNDFSENVLLKKGDSRINFIKEIENIKKRALKYKKKMLDIFYHFKNPNMFIEEYFHRDINYSDYLSPEQKQNLID